MNGISLIVDTNILIYLLEGDKRIPGLLQDKSIFISFISEIELLSSKNLTEKENLIIKNLISDSTIMDLNNYIKQESISLRRKYSLKIPDAIIAATSSFLNIPLITSDKDFKKIEELSIIYFEH